MCFSIHQTHKVRKLCASAQNVQGLINDGTLADAFNRADGQALNQVVTAFDVLWLSAGSVINDIKDVSPFLRYRREVLADEAIGTLLRALVLNLWNGQQGICLGELFTNADEHHTRIALEMIAGYTRLREKDPQFMALAAEIRDREGC